MTDVRLLTISQMTAADAATIKGGTSESELMEAAGRAVADAIVARWQPRPVVVLAGPGNNGGDGLVITRVLEAAGWPVQTRTLKDLGPDILDGDPLVVDALFGAGLARPIEGNAADVLNTINERGLDCVAVDVPSGVDGDSGAILGCAARARLTVTFFRRKPGHLLLPGREVCGEVIVADIGIADSVLDDIDPQTFANGPGLWLSRFPGRDAMDNKYSHGHVVVVGGPEMTGAARLAATAARRIGAGLVTLAVPSQAFEAYAAGEPGNILKPVDDTAALLELLDDDRINVVLVGPGCGVDERTRDFTLTALASGKAVLLDADALSVFADDRDTLFRAIAAAGPVLLTPHTGEFKRLFDVDDDKLSRTRTAANTSAAVVLLKGADTVIAAPDGRAAINEGAPPTLATAGSGDVLAGFAAGLLAQGMDAFDAASAAAWLHGRAADAFGAGLIAEDIGPAVSGVLQDLFDTGDNQA